MGPCCAKQTIIVTSLMTELHMVNSCVIGMRLLRSWAWVADWNSVIFVRTTVCLPNMIDAGLPVWCCARIVVFSSYIDSATDVDIFFIITPMMVSNRRCMAEVFVLFQNPVETAVVNIILAHANTTIVCRARTTGFVSFWWVATRNRLHVEEPSYYDRIVVWEKHCATRCFISPVGVAVLNSCSLHVLSV